MTAVDFEVHRERVRMLLAGGLTYDAAIARASRELAQTHAPRHPVQMALHSQGRPIGHAEYGDDRDYPQDLRDC